MPQINGQPALPQSPLRPQARPTQPNAAANPTAAPGIPRPQARPELLFADQTQLESQTPRATQATPSFSFIDDTSQPQRTPPNPKATLLLMNLQDALSRYRLDILALPAPATPTPEIENDLGIIANATAMIDEALSSTQNLPPELLRDLSDTVQNLVSAQPGGALESLHKPPALGERINPIAKTLSEQANQQTPDLQSGFNNAMASYTQVVNAVESSLPRLPFPMTLPIPIAYNDGKTAFVIPAGSQLRPQSNGGYQIQTPGFLALNDGTQIMGKNISLNLGEDFDGLKMDQLHVNTASDSTTLRGVEAGLNRQEQSAIIAAESVRYQSDSGQFFLENAQISQNPQGLKLQFSALDHSTQNQNTHLGATQIQQRSEGDAQIFEATSQDLRFNTDTQTLQAETLQLQMIQGPEGQQLQGSGTGISLMEPNGAGGTRQLAVGAARVNIQNQADGSGFATLSGSDIQYTDGPLSVVTQGQSQLRLDRNADGFVENLQVNSEHLRYQQGNEALQLSGAEAQLAFDSQGQLTRLSGALQAGQFEGDFGSAALTQGALNLHYDQGSLAALNANVGQFQFQDQNAQQQLNLQGLGLNATFHPDGSLNHSNLDLALAEFQTPEVAGSLAGVNAQINSAQSRLHIDSAQIKSQLESEWQVNVENLDLILQNNAQGEARSLDLGVGNSEAFVSGFNAQVRTQNGDQVRVHMGLSEDGSFLQEAFLKIPGGGEIQLQQEDLNVRLGGGDTGQKLSFTQDGLGRYTFAGEGLHIDAATADASVSVRGGNAKVSVDAQRGDLIIEDITGVGIQAQVAGMDIDVDIAEMDGFLVKATGISGLAQGAALHLVPTGEDSVIQAEIRTAYNGIPLRVKLDNVHELKALASIQPNRAHVYFGDPSGRGEVELSAGPLSMKGSAIEWTAQYHSFSPERMMSSVGRALSSEGFEIVPGVQVELDGVLRLQTPFKNGPHAGLTLLFPRPDLNMNPEQGLMGRDMPFNTRGPEDGALGVITELGWNHTNVTGTQYSTGLHAGLVSGSYLQIQQNQGSTYLSGVKLPTENIKLPTTVMAGVTFRRHDSNEAVAKGQGSRTDVMAGVYLNPAGLVDSPYISEDSAYGLYTGIEHRNKNAFVSFGSTVDLSNDKPQVGAQVRFGISF